ncbi:MAG: PHA/PHB synthase family protein [Pseudonocardia sp.]
MARTDETEPEGGEILALPSVGSLVGGLASALGQGRVVGREAVKLGGELAKIAVGRSEVAPQRGDRRFKDPAWSANPLYRRLEQAYLATGSALSNVVDSMDGSSDARRVEQARFATTVLTSAVAPTNFLPTNPAALKHAFDTGGASLVRGVRQFVGDVRHNGGMPSMVERDAFVVGRDLALTPGSVVARDEAGEVLQYTPSTAQVRERPVLIIPPPIGRYYFLDLRPGRSFVEYAVGQGLQTFMLSWRNPTAEHSDWNLDTYAGRVLAAVDTVREITGSSDVNVVGLCAGGIITTTALNHLAALGDERVHSVTYAVTLLDFGEGAPITAFAAPSLLKFARARSRRAGIITSRQMGSAFTWMRPDDLVFNYWVNNYLMGEKPPAFDVLAWNADGTNLPGALHCQFLDAFEHNLLPRPGGLTVLGTPMQLDAIKIPMFVTGAVSDHLTPWKGCYRTTQLLGGDATFVLSYSGHIASLVNPPGNPKAHYWTGGTPGEDPEAWREGSTRHEGSWWEAWVKWVTPRSGALVPAPDGEGSAGHPVLEPAPGRYVRDLPPDAAAQRAARSSD